MLDPHFFFHKDIVQSITHLVHYQTEDTTDLKMLQESSLFVIHAPGNKEHK